MSSILGAVTTGRTQSGQRIVIAGPEKVGKTTLACGAPNPLLVPTEMGFAAMNVPKTPVIETWEAIEQLCEELRASAMQGRIQRGSTIIWDSASALERAIHDKCIRLDGQWKPGNPAGLTMNSALGGFGKAYSIANEMFAKWSRYMDELAFRYGINIVVTCHVFAATVKDPQHGEYNTWDLLLHSPKNEKEYGKREFITQWADMIGFLHEPIFLMKEQGSNGPARAVSSGQGRVIAVDRTPYWVAGNRYGLTGTIPIPHQHGWNYLADAIYQACGIDVFNRNV